MFGSSIGRCEVLISSELKSLHFMTIGFIYDFWFIDFYNKINKSIISCEIIK